MAQDDTAALSSPLPTRRDAEPDVAARPAPRSSPTDAIENPGFPPHRPRVTDLDPAREAQRAPRLHAVLPLDRRQRLRPSRPTSLPDRVRTTSASVRLNNMFLGLGITLALLGTRLRRRALGKSLMDGHELVDDPPPDPRQRRRRSAARRRGLPPRQRGVGLHPPHADPQQPHRRARRLPAARRRALPRTSPRRTRSRSSCSSTRCGTKGTRLARDPSGAPIKASDVTHRLGLPRHPRGPRRARARQARGEGQGRRAAHAPRARGPQRVARARGLVVRRHRRLLQDLHARRLPRRALRAADAPPALPVPPVAVRRGQPLRGHLRPGQAPAAAAADHRRRRGLPGRAERLHRTRRPELLGASCEHRQPTPPPTRQPARSGHALHRLARRTTSTSAPASPASSRSSAARSSPTTGRSCSARSRSTASSSSCSPARS